MDDDGKNARHADTDENVIGARISNNALPPALPLSSGRRVWRRRRSELEARIEDQGEERAIDFPLPLLPPLDAVLETRIKGTARTIVRQRLDDEDEEDEEEDVTPSRLW